jgi:3-oxoacyl-[acyl-carrier protein] reductase
MDRPLALITGASRGIGRAVALQLARDGLAIVVNYRDHQEAAEATRDLIVAEGGQAVVRRFDVAQRADVEEAVKELTAKQGPIQVLVNNAAVIQDHLLMRMPDDAWHQVIATDLHGVYYCTKAVVRSMAGKRLPGRRIINITSVVGERGNLGQANYAAAKAGIIGFTKTVARELAPLGITVNAVAPGFIRTEATEHLPRQELIKSIPLGRLGEPEEVAHMVSWLVSPEAAYITGQVIRVNGGLLM